MPPKTVNVPADVLEILDHPGQRAETAVTEGMEDTPEHTEEPWAIHPKRPDQIAIRDKIVIPDGGRAWDGTGWALLCLTTSVEAPAAKEASRA